MHLTLSWDDVYTICSKLAYKIIRDGYKIDTIVAVSRGGLIPSRILSDMLNIDDIAVITAKYYNGIDERLDKPVVNINADIKGKNLLIIDDVVDTGNTMLSLIRLLDNPSIKTLTLYKKEKSRFEPDYYSEISDKWIIFPWERYETARLKLL